MLIDNSECPLYNGKYKPVVYSIIEGLKIQLWKAIDLGLNSSSSFPTYVTVTKFLNFHEPPFAHMQSKDNNTFLHGYSESQWVDKGLSQKSNASIWFYCFYFVLIFVGFNMMHSSTETLPLEVGESIWQWKTFLNSLRDILIMANIWKIHGRMRNFGDTLDGLLLAPWENWANSSHTMSSLISAWMFLILADIHPYAILHHKLPTHCWDYILFFIHKLSKLMKTPKSLSKDTGKSIFLSVHRRRDWFSWNK